MAGYFGILSLRHLIDAKADIKQTVALSLNSCLHHIFWTISALPVDLET